MKNNFKHLTTVLYLILILITVVVIIGKPNGYLELASVLIVVMLPRYSMTLIETLLYPERRQRRRRRRMPITTLVDNDKHNSEREALFLADINNIANRSNAPNLPNVNANGGIAEAFSSDKERGQTGALSDTASRCIDKSMPYSYINKSPKIQQNGGTKVYLSKENYGQKKTVENSADSRRRIDKSMPYSYMNGGTGMPVSQGFSNSAADIFAQCKTQRERLFLADINEIANSRGSGSKYSSYSSSGTGMSRNSGTTREAQFFADINEIANRKRAQNKQNSFIDDSLTADNNKDIQDF